MTEDSNSQPETWKRYWRHERGGNLWGKGLFVVRERLWVKWFVRVALDHTERGRVLEAGCGSALSSIMLAKQRGDEVVGVDLSDEALELARATAQRHGVAITLAKEDMLQLSYQDKSFDLVWNSGTLEHFEDPVPVVKEMLRVGRCVIVIIPSMGIIFGLVYLLTRLLGQRGGTDILTGDERWYSAKDLTQIFRSAGCQEVKVNRIRCVGIFPYWAVVAR